MLNREVNDRLSRTGPGTQMGELFRRFWLPALLSRDVAEPDGAPVRLRILSEDLVAFRDTEGKVGIVSAYCSHRLAPLFFGRNEEGGLRCPYHGWKFSTAGKCLETPNVAPGSPDVRRNVGIKSYPVHEQSGVIWIYMGPTERQPPFPHFEYAAVPAAQSYAARWLQRSNWSQGMEGEIDTSHINWLHRDIDRSGAVQQTLKTLTGDDNSPQIQLQETDYGFTYGARRVREDQWFWRVTQWMLPMFSLIPHEPGPFVKCGGRAWVPIDDNHVTVFTFSYRIDRPFTKDELDTFESGALFPPRMTKGPYALPDGYVIDTYLPGASKENDFQIDREAQRVRNYSGIWGIHDQDRALAESSKPADSRDPGIIDRMGEHLVSSDRALVTARRRLLKMAEELAAGIEPVTPFQPELFGVRAISKISEHGEFTKLMAQFGEEARLPGPGTAPAETI
ncbi:Rieske 2Fe-2S domain-containing protein [Sphingomonas sp. MG17]|uniref:Rieske 2Fe-2S domain-containing protein n=1 Tax=Sphingomonas tagetis TaxID=2949092 RepID=A0A9X2KKW0_9SPHN|nr:Rieske 2Fe-2S domain-containing protein [Sphingomonas tagetis]MCP3730032.1 Rieske 2Fe-2S domain-containing protein [Sphingomonas tagetis]